jgi:hypothetical protein
MMKFFEVLPISKAQQVIEAQKELIDLYEKVESIQQAAARHLATILSNLSNQLMVLQKELSLLNVHPVINAQTEKNIGSPLCHESKPIRSMPFYGGFRFAEVRALVIELRRAGIKYSEIVSAVKARWPHSPDHHVSKSSVQRFWAKARSGMLKDNGIDLNSY